MREKITTFLSIMLKNPDAAVEEVIGAIKRDFTSADGQLSADIEAAIDALRQNMSALLPKRQEKLIEACEKTLTENELDTLIAYHETAVAKRWLEIQDALQSVNNSWTQSAINNTPAFSSIIEERTRAWMAANTEGEVAQEFQPRA